MRAFLLAGAQSVVATQWPVADEAALIVAREFYDRLLKGVSISEALRHAKLALIEHRVGDRGARGLQQRRDEQRFAHPSFWAPFVLWGG
jgi:CHAT domain-containing protein